MDNIIIICTVIGGIAGIIAIMSYRKDHIVKPKEELELLQVQFMSTRSLSISVSNRLEEYGKKFDAFDELIFPGITIEKYIRMLKHSQTTNLAIETFNKAIEAPAPSLAIQSMTKSLEKQFNELMKIDGWIESKLF